ncbi:Rhodanese-like domain-containing protein [Jimgerdemannia flammicorona]|uniref:Rhodanese-like domain-containing protein n=1 Tax=Jimgerdemannia flammicorona TaxID=994334 RepID=A0A433QXP0_9FUNG|nr:Rhodanese-like domain-containing protein [Jimgerdemannia flammicorona]
MLFRTTTPLLFFRTHKLVKPPRMSAFQSAYSTASSHGVPSLISANFLLTHNTGRGPNDLGIAILDGSWHMPQTGRDAKREFLNRHIPGARFFGIDEVKDHTVDLPHMLPTSEAFARAVELNEFNSAASKYHVFIGDLGITNTDHVVIYDTVNTFSATRVYWTFKAFGHNKVSVLNGGFPRWLAEGGEVESGEARFKSKTFEPIPINAALVRDHKHIVDNIRKGKSGAGYFQVVDARPARRLRAVIVPSLITTSHSFTGADPEPRAGLSSGHMPDSISIPFPEVLNPATGEMLETDELRRLFDKKGLNLEQEIVTSCGSGITASVVYMALERAGAKKISVYDGSWTEYASKSAEEGSVILKDV